MISLGSGTAAGNTAVCTVGRSGNDLHYRGYDTLGEETVIYTAGLICFLLLRKRKKEVTQ